MVLLALLDISVSTAWWMTKNVYYAGRYVIYGRQKTEAEIVEEKVDERMKEILGNERMLMQELGEVKHLLDEKNRTDAEKRGHNRRNSL